VKKMPKELTEIATDLVMASVASDMNRIKALLVQIHGGHGAAGMFAVAWMLAGSIQRMTTLADLKGRLTAVAGVRPDKGESVQWLVDFATARAADDLIEAARLFHCDGDFKKTIGHMFILIGAVGAVTEEYLTREEDRLGNAAADEVDPGAVSAPPAPGPSTGDVL
jgi:hypothetical protein